jgi:hypothetical protein
VALNCCVTDTNDTRWRSNTSTIFEKSARLRCLSWGHDERLDQEFNSIDAQKDAGHAYVASQRIEGWIPVADDYDDPGFSGGNTERPALTRLMAEIERRLVDIVVVYKIDRLTICAMSIRMNFCRVTRVKSCMPPMFVERRCASITCRR